MMEDVGFHSSASFSVCLAVCVYILRTSAVGKGNLAFSYTRENLGKLNGTMDG